MPVFAAFGLLMAQAGGADGDEGDCLDAVAQVQSLDARAQERPEVAGAARGAAQRDPLGGFVGGAGVGAEALEAGVERAHAALAMEEFPAEFLEEVPGGEFDGLELWRGAVEVALDAERGFGPD